MALKKILQAFLLLFCISNLNAQVTIGSANTPISGALLDLKEENSPTGGATSNKGLGLPRVKLLSFTITNPATGVASTINDAPTTELWDKDEHIGLVVYHSDDCTLNGQGLYVWTGDKWTKLDNDFDTAGLSLSADSLMFYNGINTPQNITVNWKPNGVGYTPPTYTGTGFSFTFNPLSGSLPTSSPQTVSTSIPPMTTGELTANLFAFKTGTITFSFDNSPCIVGGGTQTEVVNVTQVNKALKVNTKVNPDIVIAVAGSSIASVESNAEWKLSSIAPSTGAAVTSNDLNQIKGTEKNDGTAVITPANYETTIGPAFSRYNYLAFSDAATPKRFNDIVLTVAQCTGNSDLTMRQYVDLWEKRYGLIDGVDEPDSDGNITENVNGVRWHYTRPDLLPNDPKQSIYFSSMFGTERWMITNLQTKTYTPRTATPTTEWTSAPILINTYAGAISPYTSARWGYPNVTGTVNAGSTALYDTRERLGILYNWGAATGNENPSTSNQVALPLPNYQGICPAGWHLPSSVEWNSFLTEVTTNPTKYSTNTNGSSIGATLKDMCEQGANTGKSFGVLDGGFNGLLAGRGITNAINDYNINAQFWSASSSDPTAAYDVLLTVGTGATIVNIGRFCLVSIRCKKD